MLNGTHWQHKHAQALCNAQRQLNRCQECLNHLEMIADDGDAMSCLLSSLGKLSEIADSALLGCTASFCRALQTQVDAAPARTHLDASTLHTLGRCLTLVAWQLELVDPRTGQLLLDESEQKQLLEKLVISCHGHSHCPRPAASEQPTTPGG